MAVKKKTQAEIEQTTLRICRECGNQIYGVVKIDYHEVKPKIGSMFYVCTPCLKARQRAN